MKRNKVRVIPAIDETLKQELAKNGYLIESDIDSVVLSSEQANTLIRIDIENGILKIVEYKAPHKPQFIWFNELELINRVVKYLRGCYE